MPNNNLYNTFLNTEYEDAIAKSNRLASHKLVSLFDIEGSFGKKYKSKITEYKLKLRQKIADYENQAQKLDLSIEEIMKKTVNNEEQVKIYLQDIRFYQNRIIKYDTILTST